MVCASASVVDFWDEFLSANNRNL